MKSKFAPARPNTEKREEPRRMNKGRPEADRPRRPAFDADKPERIAKRLARAGIASRREAETMIAAGRIAVNGKVLASPAVNVARTDIISVDGRPLPAKERTRLWLYHKPAGLITTARDEQGRPTIFDNLPAILPRVVSVGRLDMNTEGLLLLTNDGGLARILELPSTGWVRHYRVRAHGAITQEQLDSLKNGINVDGVFYAAAEARLEREQGSNVWISIALREGKNREIKNILGALGLSVTRLIRTSFGPFQLGELASGMVQEVRGRTLRDQLGERLAAEAELDFEAPILTPFPNAPVATRSPRASRFADHDFDDNRRRPGRSLNEAEAEAVERAESGDAGGNEGGGRWISASPRRRPAPKAEEPMLRRATRGANVWHAPGSKARGEKGLLADERRQNRRREEGERGDRGAGERKTFERRPYNRDENGERRPFGGRKQFGERRSFDERSGERGAGERKPFNREERGERKPFNRDSERRPFGERRENGERRPYNKEGGEKRGFAERREGGKPFGERKPYERGTGDHKPFERGTGDHRSFERGTGEKRGFAERKPFGDRREGERKPFGDRKSGGFKARSNSDFRPKGKPHRSNDSGRPNQPEGGSGSDKGGEE